MRTTGNFSRAKCNLAVLHYSRPLKPIKALRLRNHKSHTKLARTFHPSSHPKLVSTFHRNNHPKMAKTFHYSSHLKMDRSLRHQSSIRSASTITQGKLNIYSSISSSCHHIF